jgi:hypothetical protein
MKFEYMPVPPDFDPPEIPEISLQEEREILLEISEKLRLAEADVLFRFARQRSSTTTSNTPPPALTLDSIKQAAKLVDSIMSCVKEVAEMAPGRDRMPWVGDRPPMPFHMPNPFGIGSMPVYTSRYLGDQVTPEPPAMRPGPYYQRRLKRWRRAHPSYTKANGQFYLVRDREVWCHPDDMAKFRKHIDPRNVHRVDKEGKLNDRT